MGSSEVETPPKSEKAFSPPQEGVNVHPYLPNWATMQAYYMSQPGMPIPPPYFNAAGHPPNPYMWGTPQHMMPHYGPSYAIYPHGGVYAHPSASLGSQSQDHGSASSLAVCEAMEVTPLSIAPAKSSNNNDQSLIKKLKGPDGLAAGNGSAEASDSAGSGSGDSSGGSDGNTARGDKKPSKIVCKSATSTDNDEKYGTHMQTYSEANSSIGVGMATACSDGKQVGTVSIPNGSMKTDVGFLNPVPIAEVAAHHDTISSEPWIKDEREIKREKRKQSNRESARRSRLRKQAETEQLAVKVEALNAENLSLKSEIDQLAINSEKLRAENAALMEKLRRVDETNHMEIEERPIMSTENFLSKVNNPMSVTRSTLRDSDSHENPKLHQLLGSSPRADAVAAG